jgi:hypothetical protein
MVALSGTATDDTAVTAVSWSNSATGASGTATGTTSWTTGNVALIAGTNVISVVARDAAGNTSSDSIAVTYSAGSRNAFYLSPTGNDAAAGNTPAVPWKTFAKAFASMAGGDELILLDGTYSAPSTGYISYLGTNSGQPPSGTGASAMTHVHALNPGNVTIQGALFIGRSTRKDSYIKVQGITFEGGGSLYNTSHVTIKDCGFHGSFGIGTNDHNNGNTRNLIEDVWVWASGQRIIASNYRADQNVWRRVLVRGDGCGTASCTGSGNPNVGITVYESRDVSLQNVMVVDRMLASGDEGYADFASAQHTTGYAFGNNEWLGTLSLNSPDSGYYFEADAAISPTVLIANAVAWNASAVGFNVSVPGTVDLHNLTAYGRGMDGVRVMSSGVLANVLSVDAGRYGINSVNAPSNANVFGAATSAYNQTACTTGCYTTNPRADGTTPSLRYITRIEAGSALKGAGSGGTDIGANVVTRYGTDGTRYGDAGYNQPTAVALWPWPNEERIKREMCVGAGVTRGFCSTGKRLDNLNAVTLTSYVWEAMGNPLPSGIYP